MLNTVYTLTAPRKIEVEFSEVDLSSDKVVVRPTHLSICNADQRYYQGRRPSEILKKKLPMALIHEAIGKVVYDGSGTFKIGQYVVMIPNLPSENDDIISENYLRSSRFRASGIDGFMQDLVSLSPDRVVPLPEGINLDVAAFTELISVAYHAVSRFMNFSHVRKNSIGVWGDGNLSFLVSLILKYRLPKSDIYIFGKNEDKLSGFSFSEETFFIDQVPDDFEIDHAFECVGGEGSPKAINQIIDIIRPEGTISILGVSENEVPINTRMILEKGLRLFGSSRSGRKDFEDTVDFLMKNPEAVRYLSTIVGEVVTVKDIRDMEYAFDFDMRKSYGKTIMRWDV